MLPLVAILLLLAVGLLVAGLTAAVAALWVSGLVVALAGAGGLAVLARRRVHGRGHRHRARPADRHRGQPAPSAAGTAEDPAEPPVEVVEMSDLLVVLDLHDEVYVVPDHPRYHLAGCRHLAGRPAQPVPLDQARRADFTPCGACAPDRSIADVVRARGD